MIHVRKKLPDEFYAVQMKVRGKGVSDCGPYRYIPGDWLLFWNHDQAKDVDPMCDSVNNAMETVSENGFHELLLEINDFCNGMETVRKGIT